MHATRHSALLALTTLFVVSLAASSRATATQADPATPCCPIVSINANGVVSARQADGRVFQFHVADKTLLASLHIGQPVWADFAANQVTLKYGGTPCCQIRAAGPGAPVGVQQLQPAGATPCCAITAIDRGAGTATATVKATGEAFTFTVGDKAVLASLHTGQLVWADFAANQVTLKYGGPPCCGIAARPIGPVDGARPIGPVDGARPIGPVDGARPIGPVDGARPIGPVDGAKQLQPAGGSPCCQVVTNPAVTGRMGRLVVAFPRNPGGSRGDG